MKSCLLTVPMVILVELSRFEAPYSCSRFAVFFSGSAKKTLTTPRHSGMIEPSADALFEEAWKPAAVHRESKPVRPFGVETGEEPVKSAKKEARARKRASRKRERSVDESQTEAEARRQAPGPSTPSTPLVPTPSVAIGEVPAGQEMLQNLIQVLSSRVGNSGGHVEIHLHFG